jgi:hypothetical protein
MRIIQALALALALALAQKAAQHQPVHHLWTH